MPGLFKVVVMGEAEAGKSVFLRGLIPYYHNYPGYRATIGADFINYYRKEKLITDSSTEELVDDKSSVLQLWDTAGQERFQGLGNAFYRGAHAMVYAVDLTNIDKSLVEYEKHLGMFTEMRQEGEGYFIFLVGMKGDDSKAKVSVNQLQAFADKHKIPHQNVIITSANNNFATRPLVNRPFNALQRVGDFIFDSIHAVMKEPLEADSKLISDSESLAKPTGQLKKQDMPAPLSTAEPSSLVSKIPFKRRNFFRKCFSGISSTLGFVIGGILGGVVTFIVHNPLACFIESWRLPEFSLWNGWNIFRPLLSVVDTFAATAEGFKEGAKIGWNEGLFAGVCVPGDVWREKPFPARTVVASIGLGLPLAAGITLAVLFLLPLIGLTLTLVAIGTAVAFTLFTYEMMDIDKTNAEVDKKSRRENAPLISGEEEEDSHASRSQSRPSFKIVNHYYQRAEQHHMPGGPRNYRSFLFMTASGLRSEQAQEAGSRYSVDLKDIVRATHPSVYYSS